MTRKDFVAIAKLIKDSASDRTLDDHAHRVFSGRVADFLSTQNDRFNRKRFLDACGVEDK